jgi:hypothetical protein
MDIFLYIGVPFGVLLIPFVWAAYGIGGSATGPTETPIRPTGRRRTIRSILVFTAALVTVSGALAAASAGALARTTDVDFAIEPTALFYVLEAAVDLALAAAVIFPGWSARRAWLLRTIGVYWLCLAGPALLLADAGPGWLTFDSANGMTQLGIPDFIWEGAAAVVPALLLWTASRRGRSPAA